MRTQGTYALAALVGLLGPAGPQLEGAVNLELHPASPSVAVGATLDIALFAVSDSAINQFFSAMDVILTWDPTALELLGATDDGPVTWIISGFLSDESGDGINNTFSDGDAVYTAASLGGAAATPGGLHVTTLHFKALSGADKTHMVIVATRGERTRTQVFRAGQVNQDFVGTLGSAAIAVEFAADLVIADQVVPAGRLADVRVAGDIAGEETFGVTIVVQLVAREGVQGSVAFSPAPPDDIYVVNDPWPVGGTVSVFDTDLTGTVMGNAATIDNGTFVNAPLTFAGELLGFPLETDVSARGVWDVKLCVDPCGAGDASQWEAVPTAVPTRLTHGTLTVVAPGDGDASGAVEFRDFAQFQLCFTGAVGPIEPPAYSSAPPLPCAVYDFDEDGDVDGSDYASFYGVAVGPQLAIGSDVAEVRTRVGRATGKGVGHE